MKGKIENCHYVAVNEDGNPQFIIRPESMDTESIKAAIEDQFDFKIGVIEIKPCGSNSFNVEAEEEDETTRRFNLQPVSIY